MEGEEKRYKEVYSIGEEKRERRGVKLRDQREWNEDKEGE